MTNTPTTEGSYAAWTEELDEILRALESNETDIDELSDHVERAAQLIQLCRARLEETQLRVNNVIVELREDTE